MYKKSKVKYRVSQKRLSHKKSLRRFYFGRVEQFYVTMKHLFGTPDHVLCKLALFIRLLFLSACLSVSLLVSVCLSVINMKHENLLNNSSNQ